MSGEVFPLGLLSRREHSLAELQRVIGWLNRQGEHAYARRARAVLLHRLHRDELIYVVNESGVGERRLLQWLAWYREGGFARLLHPALEAYRQCCRCGLLAERELFRQDRNLCLACHRRAMAAYRAEERGAAAARRYDRSPARRAALQRYFSTPQGRAARRRAYLSSTLRAFRAEQARAQGL